MRRLILRLTFPIWMVPWSLWTLADLVLKDIEDRKIRSCPSRRP